MSTPMVQYPTFGLNLPMVGADMSARQLITELAGEVAAAERAGFGLVLVPEHHRGPPGSLTDPLMVSAWMLANSDRIRVGPGVLILPLASVLRVAEQGAILQHASGGRFVLGVGAGYIESDFSMFGVDRGLRTSMLIDGVETLRSAWETNEHAGAVRPALDAVPPPPLWLGAWSKRGVDRAARLADGWIGDPLHTDVEVAAMADEYVTCANRAHRPPYVIVMRELWVDETDASARKVYGPLVEAVFRYYARSGALKPSAARSDVTLDGVLADRVLCGSVATVTDRLCELHATVKAQSYVFSLRHPGGPSTTQVLEAIERLGHEVMPAFRQRIDSSMPSAEPAVRGGRENEKGLL